jgi:hypothetical protein
MSPIALANYEWGRAPVKFELAWKVQNRYRINLEYLATGNLPRLAKWTVHESAVLDPASRLSDAYDKILKKEFERRHRYEALTRKANIEIEFQDPIGAPMDETYSSAMAVEICEDLKSLDGSKWGNYHMAIRKAAREFLDLESKDNLDVKTTKPIVAAMSSVPTVPTWPQLRKLIARQTAERGAKAALAKQLHVKPAVLYNWLACREQGAPNAELTLKLLGMFWKPATK